MKNTVIIIFLGLFVLIASCNSDDIDTINPDNLINSWLESYEEGYGTFRPVGYTTFPQSLYRQYYKFMEDNTCEYLVLSPVDAHYVETGTWEYNEMDSLLNIYNQEMDLYRSLKVISISENLFQIEL